MNEFITCPGCGMKHADPQPLHGRYRATEACWEQYGELSAYYMTEGDLTFRHQHSVDAYAAQHTGYRTPPITTAFSLIGLFLALEKDYTGRQVQLVHMELGRQKKDWPRWTPSRGPNGITVLEVLHAPPGPERETMQHVWMRDVWAMWDQVQPEVRRLCGEWLGV